MCTNIAVAKELMMSSLALLFSIPFVRDAVVSTEKREGIASFTAQSAAGTSHFT